MKIRTLRGQVSEGEIRRLIVDDGNFNHGYRVVGFFVAPVNPTATAEDVAGVLMLDEDGTVIPPQWDWSDNRQIAWASAGVIGASGVESPYSVVDPNHIVVRDLYVTGSVSTAGGSNVLNYMVMIEPVDITDDQAILALIKERSQDDL